MEVPVHDVADFAFDWGKWLPVAIAAMSALWAWRSSINAKQQNQIALQSKMIELYENYNEAFQNCIKVGDFSISKQTVFNKFIVSNGMLEFYYSKKITQSAEEIFNYLLEARKKVSDFNKLIYDAQEGFDVHPFEHEQDEHYSELGEMREKLRGMIEQQQVIMRREIVSKNPLQNDYLIMLDVKLFTIRLFKRNGE